MKIHTREGDIVIIESDSIQLQIKHNDEDY